MEPTDRKMGFDYFDFVDGMGLSLRVGKVGIIACLQDGGVARYSFGKVYKRFSKHKLHWMQFSEITAQTFYDLSRLNRTPKFMLVEGRGRAQVLTMPVGGLSGKPLFDPWTIEGYAPFLAHFTRFPMEQVYRADLKAAMSWLLKDGKLKRMGPDDPP